MFPSEDDLQIGGFNLDDLKSNKVPSASTDAKPVVICRCPVCQSSNVTDASLYEHNGVYGPGSASWKSFEAMLCSDCGVMFRKVKGNGI